MPLLAHHFPAPGGTYLLGHTPVARIGYGTSQLRKFEAEPAKAEAVLRRALELGVNHIDTAQFYGNGFVNRVIGKIVPGGSACVIASKVGADPIPGGKIPMRLAQRPEQLRATVEANLHSLSMERIPLVNLRRTDIGSGLQAESDQIVDIEDQMAEMIQLRAEGKIGNIGLSAVSLKNLRRVLHANVVCVQNAYSLVSRESEDLLSFCLEREIAWVPFYPLGGAMPGMPKVTDQLSVTAIAKRLGITSSQLGLSWLLQHSPNTLLIPGTTDITHLEENLAVGSILVDQESMTELDNLLVA